MTTATANPVVKKICPTSLEMVTDKGPLPVKIGDQTIGYVCPKTFSTGSYGWGYSGPAMIALNGGSFADCQVSLNLTVKGSKPAATA